MEVDAWPERRCLFAHWSKARWSSWRTFESRAAKRSASAHEDLRKWLAGDRTTNNEWRAEHKANAPHS